MKRKCNWAAILCAFALTAKATAQAPATPLAGFVFVNAIASSQPAVLTANGRKLTRKNGLDSGAATSGLGIPIGSYQVQVAVPNMAPGSAQVQVNVGTTPVVIAYREQIVDPTTRQTKDSIKLLQLPAQPRKDKYLITALNVDPKESFAATASGQLQTLQFGKPVTFEASSLKISDAKGESDALTVDERMSYYCFVFRKTDGKISAVLVPEIIYTW